MSNQLFSDGKVIVVDGVELECVAVTYQENEEGERHSYGYGFVEKAELDAKREAERLAEEEAAKENQTEGEE